MVRYRPTSIMNTMKRLFTKRALGLILITAVFSGMVIRTAWVSDDAYITFRSVENVVNGYGPVFNIGERVQTFTHPLWFFLLSGIQFLVIKLGGYSRWAQLFYITITVSIALSVATVALYAFGHARSIKIAALGVMVLFLSKAFVDYSTSGLENPLTNLLLLIFIWIYFKGEEMTSLKLLSLAFIAGLATLNRMDTLLLVLPGLLYIFWNYSQKGKALGVLVVGFLPFILWEIFSLFYYGFLFPNTAYAKLNTGISKANLIAQGGDYFVNSLRIDPITLIVISMGIAIPLITKNRRQIPIIVGMICYLFYVLNIGGDFMSGRYFAAPLLAAVSVLSLHAIPSPRSFTGVILSILLVGLLFPTSPLRSSLDYGGGENFRFFIDENGISDERAVYYSQMGLFKSKQDKLFPGSKYGGDQWVLQEKPIEVILVGPLGVSAYQAGPNVYVIDKNALADSLMARLPIENVEQWRIGHFPHLMPSGYFETLSSESNLIEDEYLAQYYDILSLIIRGDLFDWNRMVAIWNMNTGKYDYLIEAYLTTLP